MANPEYKKDLGRRIKELRKERNLTQKELATLLGITFGQLNKYESGLNSPAPELLVKMAEALHVRLEFLLTGQDSEDVPLRNTRLADRLKILEGLSGRAQETVIDLIDAIIVRDRAQSLLQPIDAAHQAERVA